MQSKWICAAVAAGWLVACGTPVDPGPDGSTSDVNTNADRVTGGDSSTDSGGSGLDAGGDTSSGDTGSTGNDAGLDGNSTGNDGSSGDGNSTGDGSVTGDGGVTEGGSGDGSTSDVGVFDPLRCMGGRDSDGDGIANDRECTLGSDPYNRDSDNDGVDDGTEVNYQAVCVNRTGQNRPPTPCGAGLPACSTGFTCLGLSPTNRDSDGDGVPDGDEDRNLDGFIDDSLGETNPLLFDTNGDTLNDSQGGQFICRPQGLGTLTLAGIPNTNTQIGVNPVWGAVRRITGTTNRGAAVFENASTVNAAGAVFAGPVMGTNDVRAESTRLEGLVLTAFGSQITPVFVGRGFNTHDGHPAVSSVYRIATTTATNAAVLRDQLVMPFTGAAATTAIAGTSSMDFLLDITTVRRTSGLANNTSVALITISPRTAYENTAGVTAIHSSDLTNATGLTESDKGLGSGCQVFQTRPTPPVDFLWTVDTSGSMDSAQNALGQTAQTFFNRMRSANMDFRVGVVVAVSTAIDFVTPGFTWILGSDANGARTLCQQATRAAQCETTAGMDTFGPYPGGAVGNDLAEQPISAAILSHSALRTAATTPLSNPRRFRTGARVVAFAVTDEPGSNDFSRYFTSSTAPDNSAAYGTTYNQTTLNNIVGYFQRNNIMTFGYLPNGFAAGPFGFGVPVTSPPTPCSQLSVEMLPKCVVEANGGAIIPISSTVDQTQVNIAMDRIVDAIAGQISPYTLTVRPITSTLKVRVRNGTTVRDVPRSRVNGFDYDPTNNAIYFYGTTYLPTTNTEITLSYRTWRACPPQGATCVSDAQCCAPQVCTAGRCNPPCRPLNAMCTMDRDCCAPNVCTNGTCIPPVTCRNAGASCTNNADCCSPNQCINGACGTPPPPCRDIGGMCNGNSDCCNNNCVSGMCACKNMGTACSSGTDCCTGTCTNGLCARPPCRVENSNCTTSGECCSGSCIAGGCGPG